MGNSCFFIIALVALLLSNTTKQLCLAKTFRNFTTDQDALLAFKKTITFDTYGVLSKNWSSNTSMCYWMGVSCNIKHQRVTTLNISNFELRGTIPPHLGNLTFLRSLDISFNNFTGFIPSELSNLHRLEVINGGSNSFSGSIPPSFFNNSRLRTLDMSHNFLGGKIPQEIGNFSSLEMLNLEYNQFSESIPYSILNISSLIEINLRGNYLSGRLSSDICTNTPKLKRIYLARNQLFGDLPANIHKCRELEVLRLPNNNFNGSIPSEIGSLSKLQILSLYSNKFQGPIPPQVGNLTSLGYLLLYQNTLTGELPQELTNMANLVDFNVYNNSLSGSIPSSMFNISTLISLDLSFNQLSGSLPKFSLFNLQKLYLNENMRLHGTIPSSINNASNLAILSMCSNLFSGPIPNFGDLRLLQKLVLSGNYLTGSESPTDELRFLSPLASCQNLTVLQISRNPLNGILPASTGNLSTSLQMFWAYGCNIGGTIPSEIGNLSSLLNLDLSGNQLTGLIPATIGKLKQLQGLYLNYNRLQGSIPLDLCRMSNLGELYLNKNMLTGSIPECLGEIKALRNVYLGSNKLNSTIPYNIWNLRDLLFLNLSSNYLNGQLSSQIGSLSVANQIDLSFNQFSGDIPSSMDGCESLEILSLSNNMFEGSIPQSLGKIRVLRTLDLSNNNLSGLIPKSLKDVHLLKTFNVSYNRLEGEIPNEGPFVNFTDQSFLHNSALCGETRFQVSPCVGNMDGVSRSKNVAMLIKYIVPPIISAFILVIIILMLIRKQRKVQSATNISVAIAWRRISYAELVRGTNDFSEGNLIGRGSFGSVFKGILSDGLNVAVKVFNLQLEGAVKSFDTESEILSTIRHRNLVRIIGCCSNTEFKALILSYMSNGSLEKWLYSENYCLDLMQRLTISIDVALALEYLHHGHTFPVVHCDIKPGNVLLDGDMTARVADFGISKLFDEGEDVIQTKTLATIGYAAPEYGSEGKVSTNGDIYSYGVMLLEIFTRKKPTDDIFSEEMSLKEWVSVALQKNAISEVMGPGLLAKDDQDVVAKLQCVSSIFDLAMKCLAVSPDERINIRQAVAALQKIKTHFLANNRKHQ